MQPGFLREHGSINAALYVIIDMIAVIFGCYCAHALRFANFDLPPSYRTALILGVLLMLIIFPHFNLYDSWRGRSQVKQIRSIVLAWITVGACLVFIAFALKDSEKFSRLWFGLWGISSTVLLVSGRLIVVFILRKLRRRGYNSRSIAIVGTGTTAQAIASHVQNLPWSGIKVACVFEDTAHPCEPNAFSPSIELCPIDGVNLEHELKHRKIDEVWICLPFKQQQQIEWTLDTLRQSTIRQRLIPELAGLKFLRYPIADILGVPMLNVSATPLNGISRLVKDCEDKILALLFVLLASPLMLLIALAVKLTSRGPVIFKQRRHGADGQPIKVYKFRTMVVHSDADGNVAQARKHDDRVTFVGCFLRRTSLDELPQLINVLQGRMSLVGPRPHALAHNEFYKNEIEAYMQRHKIKPGITGWAQINGWRGETDTVDKMRNRVDCDMYYIENWSLWLDIKIIFWTFFKCLKMKNAY
jgi:putative colanic acid biosynthesis UDP-glucose lipid carrier transferase